jgi:predicted nucleic acid-binding protein
LNKVFLALVHGLVVVTRNVSDFLPFDAALVNPFKGSKGVSTL